jgi:uncharacterized membrane protein YqjE
MSRGSSSQSGGLFESGKRAVDSIVELALVRLELFTSEIAGEKMRVFDALLQATLGLVLLGLALVGVMGFAVLLFWEGYRLVAVGALTIIFAACGAGLLFRARNLLRGSAGGPFALTIGELQRDREGLRPASEMVPAPSPATATTTAPSPAPHGK